MRHSRLRCCKCVTARRNHRIATTIAAIVVAAAVAATATVATAAAAATLTTTATTIATTIAAESLRNRRNLHIEVCRKHVCATHNHQSRNRSK
jgi:uncharacterized protein YcfJ